MIHLVCLVRHYSAGWNDLLRPSRDLFWVILGQRPILLAFMGLRMAHKSKHPETTSSKTQSYFQVPEVALRGFWILFWGLQSPNEWVTSLAWPERGLWRLPGKSFTPSPPGMTPIWSPTCLRGRRESITRPTAHGIKPYWWSPIPVVFQLFRLVLTF